MPRIKRQHLKPRADGRYCCTYKGKQFMGNTEQEALDKREEYKLRESMGLIPGNRALNVREYAPLWLALYKRGVSLKTYNDYAKQLESLCAVVGDKDFADVSTDDVMRVYQHYDGYSQSTIHRSRMLFIALFDAAQDNGYCHRNPFRSRLAQPARGTAGTHRIITDEERNLILTTPHRMRLAALVMLYAGLRRGEALAIQVDRDIDLQAGIIHVRGAVRFDGNKPTLTTTKTASGRRNVPIFPILADELQGVSGWLVQSADGKQATQTAFARGWASYLHALSIAAGHPVSIRCHDLRHSFCTMLCDAGVDAHLAMMWMGHADEKMILRVYDHVTEERARQDAEKVKKRLESMQKPMQANSKTP